MSMMMSSYTLPSLVPAAPPRAPEKLFSPAALQLRKQRAAAVASPGAALPWAPWKLPRALRLACHAQPHTYDIPPSALVTPKVGQHGHWKINDDDDRITLEFNVGDKTEEGNLEVATTKDQALLVIRYTGDRSDDSPATSLDARLLMPPGCNKVMKAEILPNGWLEVIIAKPKQEPVNIKVTKQNKIDS
ncbi:hypothetical protein SETIT_3G365600v2 [Setaria italica]|uniref:SHSP domain-containing protein n=1 Tax=Setaria italica TaxID=4555 RepID=K3Z9Y6_SETIT|nr:uncharacterized protein LOC101759170 [Setaria italica]RCV19206.1 hypothetical protein SETIT_3G365600v2 [Setaria italica]